MKTFKKHAESQFHKDAVTWRTNVRLSGFQPPTISGPPAQDTSLAGLPSVEHVLWSISLPKLAPSHRKFKDFLSLHAIGQGGAVGTKALSRRMPLQAQHAAGCVLHNDHSDAIAKAKRLFFSVDDFEQINVLRVRLAMLKPHVHVQEFTADCISDFGFEIDDHAKAIRESLRRLCVKHEGRRSHDQIHRPRCGEDEINSDRWEHVQQITIGGTSDNLQCWPWKITLQVGCGVGWAISGFQPRDVQAFRLSATRALNHTSKPF